VISPALVNSAVLKLHLPLVGGSENRLNHRSQRSPEFRGERFKARLFATSEIEKIGLPDTRRANAALACALWVLSCHARGVKPELEGIKHQ
jgi:hypothetical protein